MIYRGYEYRMYPTNEITKIFIQWFGIARWVWNQALNERIEIWENEQKIVNYHDQSARLTKARAKPGNIWLKECPRAITIFTLQKLELAFRHFFNGEKGHPEFKRKQNNESFSLNMNLHQYHIRKINDKFSEIKLPKKVGWVKFRNHIDLPKGVILTQITVKRDAGEFYLVVNFKLDEEPTYAKGIVGIDRGIKNTAVLSTGEVFQIPEKAVKIRKNIKLQQRRLSRMETWKDEDDRLQMSNRRKRQVKRLQKKWKKVRNINKDFCHQTSRKIANRYGTVVLENLKVQKMMKSAKGTKEKPGKNVKAKSGLNQEIQFNCWGMLDKYLSYKCQVKKVDPKNTSKICSRCGFKHKKNRESQSFFKCKNSSCGYTANADHNAAINIMQRHTGKRIFKHRVMNIVNKLNPLSK